MNCHPFLPEVSFTEELGLLSRSIHSSGHCVCVCVSSSLASPHWVTTVAVKIALQPSNWPHHSLCSRPQQRSHLHRPQKPHAQVLPWGKELRLSLSSGVWDLQESFDFQNDSIVFCKMRKTHKPFYCPILPPNLEISKVGLLEAYQRLHSRPLIL